MHQAFELWFKQVLFEMDWARDTLVAMVEQGDVPSKVPIKLNSHEDVYEDYSTNSVLRLLIHRIRRADSIVRIATHGFDAMETMEPMDFLEFRDFLIPASGFQSAQLRELEILIGLSDDQRLKLNGQVYTQQFQTEKDDLTPILKKRLAQPSLKTALYICLAHMSIPGRDEFTKRFLAEKSSQYNGKTDDLKVKIDDFVTMKSKLQALSREGCDQLYDSVCSSPTAMTQIVDFLKTHGMDYQSAARSGQIGLKLCKSAQAGPDSSEHYSKEQLWTDMKLIQDHDLQMANATIASLEQSIVETQAELKFVNDFFWNEDLIDPTSTNEKTKHYTTGMTRRATLFLLSHPWTQPRDSDFECSEWSLLLSTVLKLEQAMLLWRSRHARMVELMIGRRTGTGGSSGVEYLDKTQIYRVYQDLWRIRALLVPASALK